MDVKTFDVDRLADVLFGLLAVLMLRNIVMTVGCALQLLMMFFAQAEFLLCRSFDRQFRQGKKFMIRASSALPNFPSWETGIGGDAIANFAPFVASDVIATELSQQPQLAATTDQLPQQPSLSVQAGQPEATEATMASTAPVGTRLTRVVLVVTFDKLADVHCNDKLGNHDAKTWILRQTKELSVLGVTFKKVVIDTATRWKLFLSVVPRQHLSERLIQALVTLAGLSGTVHEVDGGESEKCFKKLKLMQNG